MSSINTTTTTIINTKYPHYLHQPYRKASAYLKSQLTLNQIPYPKIGIICGSGLSGLSNNLTSTITIPYKSIPEFPSSTGVLGHRGEIVFGFLDGSPTMCFRGRFHSYEGYDMNVTALPARVMRCLGVTIMIVTNAAGGLNPQYKVGDVISIMDYIALPMMTGKNPLTGPNDDELGPRFLPTSNAFDSNLQDIVMNSARNLNMDSIVKENGTYCFVSGPMFESKAECKFLRQMGGDCVGMSTVPEIVAAHHSGMAILCLSLITNLVITEDDSHDEKKVNRPHASHQEVLDTGRLRSQQIQNLVLEIVQNLHKVGYMDQDLKPLPEINLNYVVETTPCRKSYSKLIIHYLMGTTCLSGILLLGTIMCRKKR